MNTIPLGISACVVGQAVRYNAGQAKMPSLLKKIQDDFDFRAFCPEMAAGMGVPREPVRLVNQAGENRLLGTDSKKDWSQAIVEASQEQLNYLQGQQLRGYIVKSKSPSCAHGSAKQYSEKAMVEEKVDGIFTAMLVRQLPIAVVESEQLNSPLVADRFLQRVMLADDFYHLPDELQGRHLIDLYARYKLLIMAYSPAHYQQAGQLLANLAGRDLQQVKHQLYLILFDALDRYSSKPRQINALMHIQGYFKQYLSKPLKSELSRLLERYRDAEVPLSVPITMIQHYLLLYPDQYLASQKYLLPYSDSYGLRNYL